VLLLHPGLTDEQQLMAQLQLSSSIEHYLNQVKIPLRLACVDPNGWARVLSLWYLYEDGLLYCATQNNAKVVAYLNHDARCSYEIAADTPPYCGVRGRATAELNPAIGGRVLEKLLMRYVGSLETQLSQKLLSKQASEVAIVLTPVTLHTWDYSERMQQDASSTQPKVCP